jgi:RHS repeat-associated protein
VAGQQVQCQRAFVYDGDGKRVKGTVSGVTTAYIGNHFEWTGSTSTMKKYYYAGGARVAMRVGSTLSFLLTDHLGSTAITASSSGAKSAELRDKAWGETRYTSGTTPTDFRYTGQRFESLLGLHDYGARWYDSLLGRWLQPDSIVPLESQE